MELTWVDLGVGILLAGGLAYVLLALLGVEKERLVLYIEFYKAIKENADKERKIAQTTTEGPRRFIKMEKKAQALLVREGLLEIVPPKPPAPPAAASAGTPAPIAPPPAPPK